MLQKASIEEREHRQALKNNIKSREPVAFNIDISDDSKSQDVNVNNHNVLQFRAQKDPTQTNFVPPQRKRWGPPVVPAVLSNDVKLNAVQEVEDEPIIKELYGTKEAQEVEEDEEAVIQCLKVPYHIFLFYYLTHKHIF